MIMVTHCDLHVHPLVEAVIWQKANLSRQISEKEELLIEMNTKQITLLIFLHHLQKEHSHSIDIIPQVLASMESCNMKLWLQPSKQIPTPATQH